MNVFCQNCGLTIALPEQARAAGAAFTCPRCHHGNLVAAAASVTLGAPHSPHPQGVQSSRGSHRVLGALFVLSMTLWAPYIALLIALVLGAWAGIALGRRGPAAPRSQMGYPVAALAFSVALAGGAVAKLAGEYKESERKAEAERAENREAARLAAEKAAEERQAAATKAGRDAALRANAWAKAAEFNGRLDKVQSAMAKQSWRSALDELESMSTTAEELKALDPSPPEFPPVLERYKTLDHQVRPVAEALGALDRTTQMIVRADESVKGTKDGSTWSSAKTTWQEAKRTLDRLDSSAPSVRGYLPEGLAQMSRDLDARLKRAERYADPYELKLAELEGLRILCGDAPQGCGGGWDGECIGTKSAFKRISHDPGSVDVEDCTQPALTKDHCWVSECTVRAKNAFGAKVVSRYRFGFSTLGVEVLQ